MQTDVKPFGMHNMYMWGSCHNVIFSSVLQPKFMALIREPDIFLVISTSTRIDEQSVQNKIPVLTAIKCLKRKGI